MDLGVEVERCKNKLFRLNRDEHCKFGCDGNLDQFLVVRETATGYSSSAAMGTTNFSVMFFSVPQIKKEIVRVISCADRRWSRLWPSQSPR